MGTVSLKSVFKPMRWDEIARRIQREEIPDSSEKGTPTFSSGERAEVAAEGNDTE